MPAKDALTVSLTPELNAFVHAHIASGRYHTASEVIRAGLRLLTREDPVTTVSKPRGGTELPPGVNRKTP